MKKKIGKIATIFVVAVMIVCCVFAMPRLADGYFSQERNFEAVDISILHVETFEGGKNTRSDILKSCGEIVSAENEGVSFSVFRCSWETLATNIAKIKPDMISFGFGCGEQVLPHLVEFGGALSMRDVFWQSGEVDGKVLGVPWSFGMYYFLQNGAPLHYGTEGVCSTLCGGYFDEGRIVVANFCNKTKQEAFDDFKKGGSLLGTQRDFLRAKNSGIDCNIVRMEKYTDLVQYVGITKYAKENELASLLVREKEKKEELGKTNFWWKHSEKEEQKQLGHEAICEEFISVLTSERTSQLQSKYYMQNILETGIASEPEGFESPHIEVVPNVFCPSEHLSKNQQLAFLALNGGERERNFLDSWKKEE